MYRFLRIAVCAVALAFGVNAAWAEAPDGAQGVSANPDKPIDAKAPATYESAFENYRPYMDVDVRSWRDANDDVRRIGGWQAYAREAMENEAANAAQGRAGDSESHAGHTTK